MALARRVATPLPQQRVAPEDEALATVGPGSTVLDPVETRRPAVGTTPLLDRVPTQRGIAAEPPHAAPEVQPPDERRSHRTATLLVALTVAVAMVAVGAVVEHRRTVASTERSAADVRVASALAAQGDGAVRDAALLAGQGAWTSALAAAHRATGDAAAAGARQLAADVHADPALLAALSAAVDRATSVAADPAASLTALTAAEAGVAAPAKAAQDAEAAWQAADQARIATEQQAAATAAADAAAKAAAAKAAAPRTVRKTSSSTQTGTAPSAAGGVTQAIPAGGLVCPGAPVGAGASESSTAAIGAAINAYRQANGLPALAVVRSGTLVAHAEDMAASGGIWHSGQDNIVGCTSGSVATLITAWSKSAPHNAQMLRTDVTTMRVGGATGGGWLYGAVKFSA